MRRSCDIATGHGTAKDKAQRAADHLKQSPKQPEADDEARKRPPADSGPSGS